jgi:DNA-binding IscR family transcriptional regulator
VIVIRLSTIGQCGIGVFLDLVFHLDERLVLLKAIAQRQEISLPCLEHLVAPLIARKVINSVRQ